MIPYMYNDLKSLFKALLSIILKSDITSKAEVATDLRKIGLHKIKA